jgi:hypothetical protein
MLPSRARSMAERWPAEWSMRERASRRSNRVRSALRARLVLKIKNVIGPLIELIVPPTAEFVMEVRRGQTIEGGAFYWGYLLLGGLLSGAQAGEAALNVEPALYDEGGARYHDWRRRYDYQPPPLTWEGSRRPYWAYRDFRPSYDRPGPRARCA